MKFIFAQGHEFTNILWHKAVGSLKWILYLSTVIIKHLYLSSYMLSGTLGEEKDLKALKTWKYFLLTLHHNE